MTAIQEEEEWEGARNDWVLPEDILRVYEELQQSLEWDERIPKTIPHYVRKILWNEKEFIETHANAEEKRALLINALVPYIVESIKRAIQLAIREFTSIGDLETAIDQCDEKVIQENEFCNMIYELREQGTSWEWLQGIVTESWEKDRPREEIMSVWDKSFQKRPLGQIVPKTTSGTNRSKNSLWDKSFQKQGLGQIVPKTNSEIPS